MEIHRDTLMLLGLIFLSSFISLSKQYEETLAKGNEPHSFVQFNSLVHEPSHFQFSSFGSQSASTENNQISPEPFIRRHFNGYRSGFDDKFRDVRDFEDRQRFNRFQETREFEGRPSDEKLYGMRDFEGKLGEDKFEGPKEFGGRPRNDKFHGPHNFEAKERNDKFHGIKEMDARERNDKFQGMKDLEVRDRTEKFQSLRDMSQHRNMRYEDGIRGFPMSELGRPSRPVKPWHSSHFSDHRGRQRRPRISASPRRETYNKVRENLLVDGKRPVVAEVKRAPRIVKYIADKNGFAVREDLLKPLQDTIDRTRQESRRRIVTASASGLPQSSLSQVVTSAIRVTGQSPGNGEGKFLPQIFDLNVGKRPGHVDIDRLSYSLGAKELVL